MPETREETPTSEYREQDGKRQQLWSITIYLDGKPYGGGTQWRDVQKAHTDEGK